MNMKKEYEKKVQAQLDELKAEIEKLKAKSKKHEAEAKIEYNKTMQDLKKKHEALIKKLEELKESGGDAWKDLKIGVEKAGSELIDAVKSAFSKFK